MTRPILLFDFGSSVDIRPWAQGIDLLLPECHGTSSGNWMERWIIILWSAARKKSVDGAERADRQRDRRTDARRTSDSILSR